MTPFELTCLLFGAMAGVAVGIGACAFVAWVGRQSPRSPRSLRWGAVNHNPPPPAGARPPPPPPMRTVREGGRPPPAPKLRR